MHHQAGFILKPIINKLLNTACFKCAFCKNIPTFMPSIPSKHVTHLKPAVFTQSCASLTICLWNCGQSSIILLITPKGSFLFRKQKFTAKHTASVHKMIYGPDNGIPVTWLRKTGFRGKRTQPEFLERSINYCFSPLEVEVLGALWILP